MNKLTPYMYNEGGYEFLSVHRKVKVFDPRNTDNLIILDYFNTIHRNRDTSSVYHKLLERELKNYKNPILPAIPISFQMVYHEMNMAWVDIIHQMIFIDKAFDTFYGEYREVIENVIKYDSINKKEALVYRYYNTGESIFHVAAKIWIFNKYVEKTQEEVDFSMNEMYKELKHVYNCYQELGKLTKYKNPFCIVYMCDFNNIRLYDYLQEFVIDLRENKLV